MKIVLKDKARKALRKVGSKDIAKVKKKLELLSSNPLDGKILSGEFEGIRSLRAWPLRILYTFNPSNQTITIETIDYRGSVYKK